MPNAVRKPKENVISITRPPGQPLSLRETGTKQRQRRLLGIYAETGNITEASRSARVARICHYNWLKSDPDYARRFAEATEVAADTLLLEAHHRAMDGVETPIDAKNPAAGTVRRYSDQMLMFLLKSKKPEVYREYFRYGHVAVSGRVLDLSRLN